MRNQRVWGVCLALAGAAALFFSGYIYEQVEQGRGQISDAQEKVDVGNNLLSLDPKAKKIGAPVTGSVQKQIDEGAMTADQYEQIAHLLQLGGIALVTVGGILLLVSFVRQKWN